jgi:hypothetical protein
MKPSNVEWPPTSLALHETDKNLDNWLKVEIRVFHGNYHILMSRRWKAEGFSFLQNVSYQTTWCYISEDRNVNGSERLDGLNKHES